MVSINKNIPRLLGALLVVTTVSLVALLLQVGSLHRAMDHKDLQVAAMVSNMRGMMEVERQMVGRIEELTARLKRAEERIQRLDMVASWYGPGFHGNISASGMVYDQNAYTCAHRTLPFGTVLVVEYKGKRITAVVTDRGPYITGRDLDLSKACADALGFTRKGVDSVTVYKITV